MSCEFTQKQAGETMNIDLKIKHFRETSIQEARMLAEEQIEAQQQILAQQEVEHKLAKKREADFTRKSEMENARREANRTLSTSQLEFRHSISRKQMELKNQLFEEVQKHLKSFQQTPEYETYLFSKIREVIAFAEGDEVQIFLSPEDAGRLHTLKEKSGFPLEVYETSFDGGILARIPKRNILINHTFRDNLKSVYKEFTFQGGTTL